MKIFSKSLELKLLKRICKGDDLGSYVLGKVKADYFHTKAGEQGFARINAMLMKDDGIPSWDILCEDPVVGQEERKQFRKVKKSIDDKSVDKAIENLVKYSSARSLLKLTDLIASELQEDRVDVGALQNQVADELLKIRTGSQKATLHYLGGKKDNSLKLIKDTLSSEGIDGIPTGFNTWDSVNGVIPLEACMIIGATTGGGKSIMAGQLCKNMTEMGFNPSLTSLEMSAKQLAARIISNISRIPLEKFGVKGGITKREYEKALKEYKKWSKKCLGSHMIYEPDSTPTMTQLLYSLKPYNPDIIIVDYIALLDDVDGDDDWRKMSEAVRAAKRFAKSNRIPVVILAQIGNDLQLRYSKRMLDDADIAWFWLGDAEAKENGIINIEHKKARNLNPFPFSLKIDWPFATITDLTDEDKKSSKKSGSKSKRESNKMKIDRGASKKKKLKELD